MDTSPELDRAFRVHVRTPKPPRVNTEWWHYRHGWIAREDCDAPLMAGSTAGHMTASFAQFFRRELQPQDNVAFWYFRAGWQCRERAGRDGEGVEPIDPSLIEKDWDAERSDEEALVPLAYVPVIRNRDQQGVWGPWRISWDRLTTDKGVAERDFVMGYGPWDDIRVERVYLGAAPAPQSESSARLEDQACERAWRHAAGTWAQSVGALLAHREAPLEVFRTIIQRDRAQRGAASMPASPDMPKAAAIVQRMTNAMGTLVAANLLDKSLPNGTPLYASVGAALEGSPHQLSFDALAQFGRVDHLPFRLPGDSSAQTVECVVLTREDVDRLLSNLRAAPGTGRQD